jgi:hypothetical protein
MSTVLLASSLFALIILLIVAGYDHDAEGA